MVVAISLCCQLTYRRKTTSSDFATISSCHRQAFAPIKRTEKQVFSTCDSLLTSEPVHKCLALKKKGPCSASSIKFKGAQQPSPKRISVMTQTKPAFRRVLDQKVERRFRHIVLHITTNQVISYALNDLSSLGHMHVSREANEKWKKYIKKTKSRKRKRLHKPKTGFSIEKRITLDKTNKTKRLLAPKCQAFPGGSDLDGGLSFGEKIVKHTYEKTYEKNFTLLKSTIKMQIIEDPSLVRTFKKAYECLTDIKLTHQEQLEAIHLALRETCRYSKVSSTSMFTKEYRHLFSQKTYGLYLLLTNPFERSDSRVNQISHSFGSFWNESKPPYLWGELKQKYFNLFKSDLALELVDLDRDLGEYIITFPLARRVSSLAPEYFHRRVLESFAVIEKGIDLAHKQPNAADKYAIIMNSVNKLDTIRSQTLIGEFHRQFPDQGPYEQLFYFATGEERIVLDREPFDLSSLVVKKNFFGSTGEYRFFDIFGI